MIDSNGTKQTSALEINPQHRQGNRISLGKDPGQLIEVPARLFAFGFNAHFGGAFLLEQVQRQTSYHRQALVGMAG